MSHWNNRVVRTTHVSPNPDVSPCVEFAIHEVYYNDDGNICAITENPKSATGESVEELKETLQRMLSACDKDILINEELVYSEW